MGRSKPVAIDTITFTSQKDAKTYFKNMLGRYLAGSRVSDGDALHLRALIKRHTEYDDKAAGGIDHFVVDQPPDYSTKCFHIVRANGSRIDFSYIHCIDRIPR